MKLVILCGSLEPGKDGVGDYSRQLANYCRSQNHSVLLCSLNDGWIKLDAVAKESQEIRIASVTPWPQRIEALQKTLDFFQPDFISLQFVPYAYHKRGFCRDLALHLRVLAKKYRWQIMFHELWLGLNKADSLKYKLLGFWQRRHALQLVRTLSPKVTHTQSAVYAKFLLREQVASIRLPLFSNIDIVASPDFAQTYDLLTQHGLTLTPENRSGTFVILFFGSLHPEWTPDLLMQKMAGKKSLFLSLGRLGGVGGKIWRQFSEKYAKQARFMNLGELTAPEISTALQFADAGVAASPWNLIEKSGSVVAMLEHGLPVIVTRNDFLPNEQYEFDASFSDRLHPVWLDTFDLQRLTRQAPSPRLPAVGSQFLADLEDTNRQP